MSHVVIWRVKMCRKPLIAQFWGQWLKQYCWKCGLWIRPGPCAAVLFSWDAHSEGGQPQVSSLTALKPSCSKEAQTNPCGQSTREALRLWRESCLASLQMLQSLPFQAQPPADCSPVTGPKPELSSKPFLNSQLAETVCNNKIFVVVLSLKATQQ